MQATNKFQEPTYRSTANSHVGCREMVQSLNFQTHSPQGNEGYMELWVLKSCIPVNMELETQGESILPTS